MSASKVDVGVDGAESEIKVERSCDPEWSAEDFDESVIKITVIGIVVIVIPRHAWWQEVESKVGRHCEVQTVER